MMASSGPFCVPFGLNALVRERGRHLNPPMLGQVANDKPVALQDGGSALPSIWASSAPVVSCRVPPGQRRGMTMESWRNRKTLILSRTDMMGLVTPAEYVSCVEQAYRMHGEGRYYMDPKGHIVLDKYPGEWEAMPSYIEEPEAAACKWVSIRERNREKFGLPTVFSILIYTHPETGFPLAICDGSYHTVMRTGASAAVSAKWLAHKNAKKLAIVGAGHMAEGTLATCDTVFAWDEVRIWSRSQTTLDAFVRSEGPKFPQFPIRAARKLEEVVRGALGVVPVPPAREPLVKDEWIAPGTHIAAR